MLRSNRDKKPKTFFQLNSYTWPWYGNGMVLHRIAWYTRILKILKNTENAQEQSRQEAQNLFSSSEAASCSIPAIHRTNILILIHQHVSACKVKIEKSETNFRNLIEKCPLSMLPPTLKYDELMIKL